MPKTFAQRQFRIAPGRRAQLARRDPADASAFPDRKAAEAQSKEDAEAINELQDKLYAEGRRALLVVLQGTDTSGKDGTIRHVFNETGPLGVTVTAFRRPSEEELAHDFLWRAHLACPRRGTIGIFNRSHYEDVLVGRVRKLAPAEEIERRYEQINAFEKMLAENGTTILKFMLHISRKEQGERLQDRLDEPKSRWKFDPRRPGGPQALGRISGGLRDHARHVLDAAGRRGTSSRPTASGRATRRSPHRARDAGGHGPAVSRARLGPEGLQGRMSPVGRRAAAVPAWTSPGSFAIHVAKTRLRMCNLSLSGRARWCVHTSMAPAGRSWRGAAHRRWR